MRQHIFHLGSLISPEWIISSHVLGIMNIWNKYISTHFRFVMLILFKSNICVSSLTNMTISAGCFWDLYTPLQCHLLSTLLLSVFKIQILVICSITWRRASFYTHYHFKCSNYTRCNCKCKDSWPSNKLRPKQPSLYTCFYIELI